MKSWYIFTLFFLGSMSSVAYAAAPAGVDSSLESRFQLALQDMVKKNSDDYYEVASLVLKASGDMLSFQRMMQDQAAKENPAAQLWLARYLRMFVSTEPTVQKRVEELLRKAASRKYIPAMVEYAGVLYSANSPEAGKKGLTMLMDACRQGDSKARALYLMVSGRMQSGGITSPEVVSELKKNNYFLEEMIASAQQEESSFIVWMEKAAEHGSAFASFALCEFVAPEAAEKYMQQAVNRHFPAALGHVGSDIVRREAAKMEQFDAAKAAEGMHMLHLSAMLCTPAAYGTLASLYAEGYGKSIPRELIYELYRTAHRCGDPNGTAGLGYCMVLGVGCKQDPAAGIRLMESARDKGAQWVNQALASVYFNGDGVPANMNKAIDALMEDYVNGSRHAYALMAAITAIGNASAAPDPRRARMYLDMAISNGDPQAGLYYDLFVKEGKWRFLEELVR